MPNANQTPCPSDPGCEYDPRHPADGCNWCGLGRCYGCDAYLPAATLYAVYWVPGAGSPGRKCLSCVNDDGTGAEMAHVTDGVPLPAGDEDTGSAKTVRAEYEPIGDEGLGDVRARRAA